ncbi:MAG: hypothetical protein E6K59_11485 [Nitrospirae bacterium]|nr:MAG: hypothetical protein E6K59_11485 [Nitrospirota bacterium]
MAQYELNLRDYWLVLRKRKWIIVFTVLLVAGFTLITTEFFSGKPLYEASARVNQSCYVRRRSWGSSPRRSRATRCARPRPPLPSSTS